MHTAAFFLYIFLSAFTPGPNNIMAMYQSTRGGLRRGMIFCLGVLCGVLATMTLCAVFTTMLLQYLPAAAPVLKWVGVAYILFLAVVIFRDKPAEEKEKQPSGSGGLLTGLVMQFVNVKLILYGITALSTFVLPYSQSGLALVGAVLVLSLVGFAGTSCWALFGFLFRRFFTERKHLVNIIMALLLVGCAVASAL